MKKTMPRLTSDEEAERFVETADLSEYDLSGFKRVSFEFNTLDQRKPPKGRATAMTRDGA